IFPSQRPITSPRRTATERSALGVRSARDDDIVPPAFMSSAPEPPRRSPASAEGSPPSTLLPRAVRLTGVRTTSRPPPSDESLLRAITDVLLAAAHADGQMDAREQRTLRRLLTELAGTSHLPSWLEEHIA